ncbi:ABC transporter ATP-binding protein [Pyrofollis japonicus]|jgi:branched-chain amino acid transport system ATP-binding protein|uniref:ABC transporter ATP-binding protein n=1 Tax=Pyrofollis japonicus TaxID=3060460 RepID=UPI00295BC439|nr:ABC transporter ATP-binding protein [Pyrofollis japonicus]BEP17977.1 ABC transporter ATP-binding protein [Pyrofollis japonicus]
MTEPLLRVENLHTGYGRIPVLWDVSLSVEKGTITALIGSNGAGKTTTLRAIAGILPAWKGRIVFEGRDVTKYPSYKRVEMGIVLVPEGRGLFPQMTVYENLLMGAYNPRARLKIPESLERVFNIFPRLKERLNQKAGTLSGGEQQMLAIARGLMALPKLLMIDEASLGLAPKLALEIMDLVKRIREEEGLTILIVEQNVHYALNTADYAYVLETGRIRMKGPAKELAKNPEIIKAYLGVG